MKRKVFFIVTLGITIGLAAGCDSNQKQQSTPQTSSEEVQQPTQTEETKTDETQEKVTAEPVNAGEKILINQLGYLPDAVKKAVFKEGNVGDSFNVVDTKSDEVVYTGTLDKKMFSASDNNEDLVGEFSKVTNPGTYKITSDVLGESYEFTIAQDVYKDVFKDAVKFFYYQRCGQELTEEYAGNWAHPACHTELATIYGTDKKIDVSGGWHDAGDYGRYVVATSKTVADLMLAYESNPEACTDDFNIPESGNGVPDILDEVKYQMQWLLKMQDPESGGVYHKVTCADFPGFVMPQEEKNELIVCPISTTATGDFAAVMAMGYETYKEIDKDLADKCLAASKKAWDYLDKTPKQSVTNPPGIATGAYEDNEDEDERFWAAMQLYKVTGDAKYQKKIEEVAKLVDAGKFKPVGYGWNFVPSYAMDAYLKCDHVDEKRYEGVKNYEIGYIDTYLKGMIEQDPYEITNSIYDFCWGSNMNILNNALALDQASKLANNPQYEAYAVERVNYCFGKNPMGMSYVTGYGTVYPKDPHHRPSIATGKTIPGMIIGGPNASLQDDVAKAKLSIEPPGRRYIDDHESYSTNEVDIYWNSTLVYALAKLHLV